MLKKMLFIFIFSYSILSAQKIIHKSPFYRKPSKNPIIKLSDIRVPINGDAITNVPKVHREYVQSEIDRASILIRQKKFKDAIDICDNIIDFAPNYYSGYFTRAYAYEMQGDYHFALTDYQKSISFYPRSPYLYERLSALYNRYGQYKSSLTTLLTAFKVFDTDYSWLLLAGNIALDNNDIQTADYYYMMIMKTKSKGYAYEGLGNIEYKIGRPDVAQDAYNMAHYYYSEENYVYQKDFLAPYNKQRIIDNIRRASNFGTSIPF